jgi:hypothetical protein
LKTKPKLKEIENVEIFRFHLTEPTKKMIMIKNEWKFYKKQKGYRYVIYQFGWNETII